MLSAPLQSLYAKLADALDEGPPVEPVDSGIAGDPIVTHPDDAPAGTAVVIRTSGSSGEPKRTALTVEALAASAEATAMHLRADGQWLLALPTHYVAGVSVLTRSLFAGTAPVGLDVDTPFTADAFTAAAAAMTDRVRLTSLVPTQLQRLLADPSEATLAVLKRFDAILVGGGRTPDAVRAEAAKHGLTIRLTYGMSETCGGCVYDGVPLPGVQVRAENGRLSLGGPMVAAGYIGDPERTNAHFSTDMTGERWFLTDDLGSFDPSDGGRVSVEGRVDDVVVTGGVKISAAAVQRVLEAVPDAGDAIVVGVPDPEWGAAVACAYTGDADAESLARLVRAELGGPAVPKRWLRVGALPRLANGKPDRRAVVALF
ncbi:AMP-binding protein [Zhihengliuella halotolerans]|uniref:O-succinylbenzoic acid--CoA ligase n=1 Tax=Zhihengliuella halotolerans TaxID=370736 RepID=A0A4Q8AFD4_9MICC|nr:AMP-binding protein [Zhihengliuella halotolerans]RZU62329.1 O-succinylbenzoic acid--CoA ligase [Zhihengliuella halotolerans]